MSSEMRAPEPRAFATRSAGRLCGQLFSMDFVVAAMVLVLCLAFINSYWANAAASANDASVRNRLSHSALLASEALLSGPGIPSGWEGGGAVEALGIADGKNEINQAKLAALCALPEDDVGRLLGIDGAANGYYLAVEGVSAAIPDYHSGSLPLGRKTAAVTRYAVMGGEIVRVRMHAYQ